jgi:hypothetical protein
MTKTPRRPVVKKLRRNAMARVLATPKFRPRVVKPVDAYKRRPRHAKPPIEEI